MKTARPASDSLSNGSNARIICQLAVTLTAKILVPVLRLDVAERRWRAQNAGIADQHIEAAVTLFEREREPRDAVTILHVERHQSGRATRRLDVVVEFLKATDGARHGDDVCACLRELQRERGANAARGAGDQRDTVGEGL